MEPILDEASLIPCPSACPGERIVQLAETLSALDLLGAPRVLRAVCDAGDRDLCYGRGLRYWCNDRHTPRDAGRLVLLRLSRAPFVDGPDGLFAKAEASRAIESTILGKKSLGGGLAALADGVLLFLKCSIWPPAKPVVVRLEVLTEDVQSTEEHSVDSADCALDVRELASVLTRKLYERIGSGAELLRRMSELFPHLVLGDRAREQIGRLSGSEPFFPQILRHFRALNAAARVWQQGTPFEPEGVSYSTESVSTLRDGRLGPLRDFPTPHGFSPERWSLHTKLTGGASMRLYFKAPGMQHAEESDSPNGVVRVPIGYVGPHLPTVNYG